MYRIITGPFYGNSSLPSSAFYQNAQVPDDREFLDLSSNLDTLAIRSTSKKISRVNTNDEDDPSFMFALMGKWKAVKLTREVSRGVPTGILPEGVTASLTDVSVNSKGPDNDMFKANDELRMYLPRGMTVLTIGNRKKDIVIYANKKFFEYESEKSSQNCVNEWELRKYFLDDRSSIHKIIAMDKINGEAAHFSGRIIKKKFYFIAGSKNVHVIFNKEHHLNLYTEDRYSIALTAARSLLRKWEAMDEESQRSLADFLHAKKVTVFCEIMLPSKQHVVNLSSLDQDKLVVLGVTGPPQENPTSLTAMASQKCLHWFSELGFETPNFESLHGYEYDSHFSKTRKARHTEGIVYYFEDFNENTIGMVKLKSSWYVHLRALREQATFRHSAKKNLKTLEEAKARARKRMSELQEFLFTPPDELEAWKKISDLWMEFIEEQVLSGIANVSLIRNNFPLFWKPFTEKISQTHGQLVDIFK